MNRLRPSIALAVIGLLLLAGGCATRFRSDAHVDTTYDFSKVSTFAFAPERSEIAAARFPRARPPSW